MCIRDRWYQRRVHGLSQHHIYLTNDGRISIAGLNTKNVNYVAEAMDKVTRTSGLQASCVCILLKIFYTTFSQQQKSTLQPLRGLEWPLFFNHQLVICIQKSLRHFSFRRVTYPPCLLYTSPSPRDGLLSRMPSSA
eukprot:TRINITY_DN8912_c0_g1_i3.p2 TRINITY_DN8912_c0_g1~~TRINITY_DN8912_c0_g1_i3.p2  ORF type:complete len:136 (-),score=27.54 TRINITY_DN8912_c0_g1_i3:11-418(-)